MFFFSNWLLFNLHCRTLIEFAANAVRLQLHALAYNLANFLRTLATPEPMSDCAVMARSMLERARSSPRATSTRDAR